MERNEKLAGLIMQKTAAVAKPARNYFLEGYLQGYMGKEAQATDGKGIDWSGMWDKVKAGAGELVPKGGKEWAQTAGGAGLGALAGGALGGWKGALGGAMLGGVGGGFAARKGYFAPGISEITEKIKAIATKNKAKPVGPLADAPAPAAKSVDEQVLTAGNPELEGVIGRLNAAAEANSKK